jgi:hypothetical protein
MIPILVLVFISPDVHQSVVPTSRSRGAEGVPCLRLLAAFSPKSAAVAPTLAIAEIGQRFATPHLLIGWRAISIRLSLSVCRASISFRFISLANARGEAE